jgi:hypothetical protein
MTLEETFARRDAEAEATGFKRARNRTWYRCAGDAAYAAEELVAESGPAFGPRC